MAPESDTDGHVVEIEDALLRPGTYFNPQTEVVVVVDDSASIDQEVFNMEAYEGAEWVRITDEVPIDEEARDAALADLPDPLPPGLDGLGLGDGAGASTIWTPRRGPGPGRED